MSKYGSSDLLFVHLLMMYLLNIIQLLTGVEGNIKYISPEIPTIALCFASGNSWYLGANIFNVALNTSQ